MTPLIVGLTSAALFLGLTLWVYGIGALAASAWIPLVLAGLVGSGLLVTLLNRPMPAWMCRIQDWLGLAEDLCVDRGYCR